MASGMLNTLYKFWFEKKPATPLGLVRILFGLAVLLSFVYESNQIIDFYSTEGFVPGEYVPAFFRDTRFSLLDYFQEPAAVYVLYAAMLIVFVLFTVGYKTKYMKFLQFILLLSFQERNFLILNSGDTLLRVISFYLMISPCGESLSIDSLKKHAKKISVWSIRLIQFQLAVVYFFAGIAKFGTQSWMDGSAVNYILRNSLFNRFSMDWIIAFPFIIMFLTWFSLTFELALPFLIWFKKFRRPILGIGVFLHISIFLFLDVGWFSLSTLAIYPIFLKHEEIMAANRLARKWVPKVLKRSLSKWF